MKILVQDVCYLYTEIAEIAGIFVLMMEMLNGKIPDAQTRTLLHTEISSLYAQSILIFVDPAPHTQSLWRWVKHDADSTKAGPREHLYLIGQPSELALGKLYTMLVDVEQGDHAGKNSLLAATSQLQKVLTVDRVKKRFYEDFKQMYLHFLGYIEGIAEEQDRCWYASIVLSRLMFIYFLQQKGLLDRGNTNYLEEKLAVSRQRGQDRYYHQFLTILFSEGFAKPEEERSEAAKGLLGKIAYLHDDLFLLHVIEKHWLAIQIPDQAFECVFALFARYCWHLDNTPSEQENAISPAILGYIFEKYANQKVFGAYYTRSEITTYLCEQTIYTFILEKMNAKMVTQKGHHFATIEELLLNLDEELCRDLLALLPEISILDPACGSGAFLLSALNTLMQIYGAIVGKIAHMHDVSLNKWLCEICGQHKNSNYALKKKIISENLFGVDMMEEATKIAKRQLFLALLSSIESIDQLEPLPHIDFNILVGNALIGFRSVKGERCDESLKHRHGLQAEFHKVLAEKNRLVQEYKTGFRWTRAGCSLSEQIQVRRAQDNRSLNQLLLSEFTQLGVKYEHAIWDETVQKGSKIQKRALTQSDIAALHPFHWGYEFDHIMNERGGFDIIITNPPWEALKPQGKEFFAAHAKQTARGKMSSEALAHERSKLLQNKEISAAWLNYQNCFPYQSLYFRSTQQYKNQISIVNGKKVGTDINFYKLFTEQCYNLLKPDGACGIVVPSGLYTDLGAKQLRTMLFRETQITGLFSFENRKVIFEGVDSRFKFVVLTFKKGGETHLLPASFMRHDLADLAYFLPRGALHISTDLINRLSPRSFSIMEFKHDCDIRNAEKMLKAPLLTDKPSSLWNFTLANEFHMTSHNHLFTTASHPRKWPLYEGKQIHQFTHELSQSRYWIDSKQGRDVLLRQELRRVEMALDAKASLQSEVSHLATRKERVSALLKMLGYPPLTTQSMSIAPCAARLVIRDIARNTDKRTLIATILPPAVFASNTLNYVVPWSFNAEKIFQRPLCVKECYEPALPAHTMAYLCGVLNSFVLDYFLRFKVTTHVNIFYLYQLPIPRLAPNDPRCIAIAARVGQLLCIGPEFDELRYSLLGDRHACVAIDPIERQKLCAEIDGLVAQLYEFTEEEFLHILHTFPLVEQCVKDNAIAAYRHLHLTGLRDNHHFSKRIGGR